MADPPLPDWSQLPKDLLHHISQKLNSQFYHLRFRSVCSSWRSSTTPTTTNHHLPSHFPTPSTTTTTTTTFPLSQRTLFLITPPPIHPQTPNHQTLNPNPYPYPYPWLIKITPNSPHHTLYHPLSRNNQFHLPSSTLLDFNNHRVFDLGTEFVIDHNNHNNNHNSTFYMEKVVVFNLNYRCSILLTIHVSGKLAVFRSGDERWTIISEMVMPFDDVCVFNGRAIAVDGSGRAVEVRNDLGLDLVADAVFGGDKKILVESDGELLLVDKYLSCVCYDDNNIVPHVDVNVDGGIEFFGIGRERAVRFDVFRLCEKEKKWVEVRDLGDRVLFLGEDYAFSASALDSGIGKGNCVIYRDDVFRNFLSAEIGIGVFQLDQHWILPLSDFPCYSKLFWPPPEWVELRRGQ